MGKISSQAKHLATNVGKEWAEDGRMQMQSLIKQPIVLLLEKLNERELAIPGQALGLCSGR